MIIGSKKRLSQVTADPAISVGNLEIKRVETTKSLGLMIDESLDWTAQVEHISKKVTPCRPCYSQTTPGYSRIQYLNNNIPIHNSTLFRLLCSSVGLLRKNISS